MKITTRFLYLDILLVAIALAVANFTILTEIYSAAESSAIKEQASHLKTFLKLIKAKGGDFRISGEKMLIGDYLLNGNNELPDQMQEIFGCTATIFMGDTRISTNVLKPDGTRAVGTRLQGAAYDAIFRQKKSYRGEALILGTPYLTAYDPIRNEKGDIIGAVYVGVKKSDYFVTYERLKEKIYTLTFILILLFSTFAFLLIRFRRKADDAVKDSEMKYRKLFELQSDAILMVDRKSGEILEANASASNLFGYTRKEFLGKTIFDVSAEPEKVRTTLSNYQYRIPSGLQRKKDGTIFPVEILNGFFEWQNRNVLIAAIRDITERKRAEDSMSRLNRILKTLTKCDEILVRAENEADLLREICRVIVEDGGYLFVWVGYAEDDGEKKIRPMAHAGLEEGYLDAVTISWDETETGIGPIGRAIRTQRPSYVEDTEQDPAFGCWRQEASKRGYRSSVAIPFVSSEQIGSLNIYASEPHAFDSGDIELMVQLANDLAYGIKSLRTREKHRMTSEALWASAEENRKLADIRDQERNLLRALIDSIPDLIFFKDHESVYLGCNKAFETFAGRAESELIGHTDFHLFPREVGEFFQEMDRQMMIQRAPRRNEEWVVYPDGRRVFLETLKTPFYDKNGRILGLIGISRDFTERKQAENRLNEQLHFTQQMLNSIPIPVFYKNVQGCYLGCNSAFETFFGITGNDLVGKTAYDIAPKELADVYQEADAALFSNPGVQVYETSVMHQNGMPHEVIFSKATYLDADGRVSGLVGAIMDISQRRKAEEERKILEVQLQQAQKMEAIGQLAGGIAHDFNNILTAIVGYAELISMRIGEESSLRHFVDQVLLSSGRAAELVNGLLAFSRKQVLHPKPLDLCEIVRGLRKMLGRIIREDIDFRTSVPDQELVIMADRGQIEQVLMNFVTNAKDAMPQGGILSIDVSPVLMDEGFVHAHGFGESGYYACISVTDSGCGMSEETQKKIFEPFYTTKEVGKGTGLGMAIIYGIVKQHNGYINVYSESGMGTTFRVYLPLLAEEMGEPANLASPELPAGGSETILLVEDDDTVRELHTLILQEAGYTVIQAIDGQDAIVKFMEHISQIDLLATDVIMPKIDGKRLFQEIQKFTPQMKVIYMSGYTRDIVIEKGILEDASNFIAKPVTACELLGKVRIILDRG